jgi:hypothetical protein
LRSAPLTNIRAMVVRHSLSLALSGVAIGVAVSLLVSKAMSSMLYGVSPVDPLSLALVGITCRCRRRGEHANRMACLSSQPDGNAAG